MISQLSMRSVSNVYSILLLTHVRLCIPSFQSKLFFFVDSIFSLALVSQCIYSFRLILIALCIQCFPWQSLCYGQPAFDEKCFHFVIKIFVGSS